MSRLDPDTSIGGPDGRFPSTRHTLIERVRGDDGPVRDRALDEIVAIYWKPLYKYVRLGWNKGNEEAKDLTQGFLSMIIERDALEGFDPARGTFRTWLRTLMDRFISSELKRAMRLKRGGGLRALGFDDAEDEIARLQSPYDSPEEILRKEWIRSILEISVERLESRLNAEGKTAQMRLFRTYDLEGSPRSYRELAAELAVPETSVTNWLAAARRRFRSIVLETLRSLTASEEEFRQEARDLLGVEP